MFATPIIPQADQEREPARSPWYRDWRVKSLLDDATANGATIQTEREYFGRDFPDEALNDEWFLDVDFASLAWVHVRYTTDSGMWRLEVDTMSGELQGNDLDAHTSAALAISHAAKLCRDLNALIARERARDARGDNRLSDEVLAVMHDREMTPQELAGEIRVSYSTLMSKLSGRSKWSAVDLLRLRRTFGADQFDRLVEAVEQ